MNEPNKINEQEVKRVFVRAIHTDTYTPHNLKHTIVRLYKTLLMDVFFFIRCFEHFIK